MKITRRILIKWILSKNELADYILGMSEYKENQYIMSYVFKILSSSKF